MIQSMTGYGAVERVADGVCYALELRSVNHRYLKLSTRLPEDWKFAEPTIEKVARSRLTRGSVTCTLRVRAGDSGAVSLNLAAMQSYVDQMLRVRLPSGTAATIDLAAAALLPGSMDAPDRDEPTTNRQLQLVEQLMADAVDSLTRMRRDEGTALEEDLRCCCADIRTRLETVSQRAPTVVEEYRKRLQTRVGTLMEAGGFELAEDALAREVAIYAERCDISEEITRLTSHLDQFEELCKRNKAVGRTLEFLTQELLREANTIASKSNDATISRSVVDVKGLIERLREQVQNVE